MNGRIVGKQFVRMWNEVGTDQPEASEIITWHWPDQLRETTKNLTLRWMASRFALALF